MVQSEADGKRLSVVFLRTEAGAEPVREWLKSLDREERKTIGIDIKTVEFGWPIGMPTCRAIGQGIWEVRSTLPRGRIARVLFGISESQLILLHGFIKKTRKTPRKDLNIAMKRLRQLDRDS
jgi:phage-related protein